MVLGMYNMLYLTSVINAGAKKDTGNWSIDGDGAEGHYHKDTSYCTMCAWIWFLSGVNPAEKSESRKAQNNESPVQNEVNGLVP